VFAGIPDATVSPLKARLNTDPKIRTSRIKARSTDGQANPATEFRVSERLFYYDCISNDSLDVTRVSGDEQNRNELMAADVTDRGNAGAFR
jgi:hypothetical protein